MYTWSNANCSGNFTGADMIYLVAFINGSQTGDQHQECLKANGELFQPAFDFNGNCEIQWSDVTYGVQYFKGYHSEVQYCPEFPPFQYPRH
jgi:hypothetical protein